MNVKAMPRQTPIKNSPVPPCGTPPQRALVSKSFHAKLCSPSDPVCSPFKFFLQKSRPLCLCASVVKKVSTNLKKIATFPEDQQLMSENEPEKNLKIQLSFRLWPPSSPSRSLMSWRLKPIKFFGHSNISPQNLRPF